MSYKLILSLGFLLFCLDTSPVAQTEQAIVDSAKITFRLNVNEALLILNNRYDEARFIKNNETITTEARLTSVKLSVIHDFLFEKKFELMPDSMVIVAHEFERLPMSKKLLDGNFAARKILNANLLIISDEQSKISIDGIPVATEFTFYNALTGNLDIEVALKDDYQSIYFDNFATISPSSYRLRVVERHIKPLKSVSRSLAFLPGYSQAYKYQHIKANILRVSIGTSFFLVSTLTIKFRINNNEYENHLRDYENSVSGIEATALGDKLLALERKLERDVQIRNLSLFTFIGLYTYNILDGFFAHPKMGYREKKPYSFYLNLNPNAAFNAGVKIDLGN